MEKNILTHKLKTRNLQHSDYNEIRSIMEVSYAGMGGAWTKGEFSTLLSLFPEGQICIEDRGNVVAVALTLIIDYSSLERDHSYEDIVSDGRFESHDNEGDYLYGIDMFIRKDYQGMRLGRRLYDARKELCEKLNLKGILVGGRIPGYSKYHKEMSPGEYIQKVKNREIVDKVLTFQLANDFHPKRAIRNYIPEDKASKSHAVFLVWDNIFYQTRKNMSGGENQMSASVLHNGRCGSFNPWKNFSSKWSSLWILYPDITLI